MSGPRIPGAIDLHCHFGPDTVGGAVRPLSGALSAVQAAREAAAHDFIIALPDGYDTQIDQHTAQLSGGQLQRIAIARAMLRDAPVLVLDEPTTGLDALAAQRVIGPLRKLMSGRTTIMITHDLNLAPHADRVLVLDQGRLVETGTHRELLSQHGLYGQLHAAQNGVEPVLAVPGFSVAEGA